MVTVVTKDVGGRARPAGDGVLYVEPELQMVDASEGTSLPDTGLNAPFIADHRSVRYRETVNDGGVPSENVIDMNRGSNGREYRDDTNGEHPVADLRQS